MESTWTEVDDYFAEHLAASDRALDAALEDSEAAGLPAIAVTANQGKFLQVLVRMRNARRVLEIGTLGGYSTIWIARALGPGGRIISLEIDPKHAMVARKNVERADVGSMVDIRVGPAAESLADMKKTRIGPFDLVFIDADKASTLDYYEASLELSKPGTVIVIDNVARHGTIIDADSGAADVKGMRNAIERIGRDDRVVSAALQTVGSKGYDGFLLAVVR